MTDAILSTRRQKCRALEAFEASVRRIIKIHIITDPRVPHEFRVRARRRRRYERLARRLANLISNDYDLALRQAAKRRKKSFKREVFRFGHDGAMDRLAELADGRMQFYVDTDSLSPLDAP